MSKKATEFRKKEMSKMYRGKEIFKPLNTGWIDDNFAFAFAHTDKDPLAPYDAYDESGNTEENAKRGFPKGVGR